MSFLLSDGEDNSGALTGLDAAALAAKHGIKIHTIGFSSELDSDGAAILRGMSEVTGGEYFVAQSPSALAEISGELDRIEPSASDVEQNNLIFDWSGIAIVIAMLILAGLTRHEIRQS